MTPILPQLTHPMDRDAETWLKAMYQTEELSAKVIDAYNQLRLAANRISAPAAGHSFLYSVIALSGVRIPEAKTTFLDYIRAGLVKVDQPLLAQVGKDWQPVTYLGYRDHKVVVDQGGVTKTFDPKSMKFPKEEMAAV